MFVLSIVIALIDIFVLSQLSFFGVILLPMLMVIHVFKDKVGFSELVASAAIYGFLISIFYSGSFGALVVSAHVLAAMVAWVIYATLARRKPGVKVRRVGVVLFTAGYSLAYFAPFLAWGSGQFSNSRLGATMAVSILANAVLLFSLSLVYRGVRSVRG